MFWVIRVENLSRRYTKALLGKKSQVLGWSQTDKTSFPPTA